MYKKVNMKTEFFVGHILLICDRFASCAMLGKMAHIASVLHLGKMPNLGNHILHGLCICNKKTNNLATSSGRPPVWQDKKTIKIIHFKRGQ